MCIYIGGVRLSRTEADGFTDSIQSVLNDETGRRLFKNFMIEINETEGVKKLNVYIQAINCTTYQDIDSLMSNAMKIEELDGDIIGQLIEARTSRNGNLIIKKIKEEIRNKPLQSTGCSKITY